MRPQFSVSKGYQRPQQQTKVVETKDNVVEPEEKFIDPEELQRQEGETDAEYELRKTSKYPEDTKFILTTKVNGEEKETEASKTEVMSLLKKNVDAEDLSEGFKNLYEKKPLIYQVNLAGQLIQHPFDAFGLAFSNIKGDITQEDVHDWQGRKTYEFGEAFSNEPGSIELVKATLAPGFLGEEGHLGQATKLITVQGASSLAGQAFGTVTGYGMGRAPILTSIGQAGVGVASSALVGRQLGKSVGKYMNAETPEEKISASSEVAETGLTFIAGYAGMKSGMKSTRAFGKNKGLTSYESSYPKGYRARIQSYTKQPKFQKLTDKLRITKYVERPTLTKAEAEVFKEYSILETKLRQNLKGVNTEKMQYKWETRRSSPCFPN